MSAVAFDTLKLARKLRDSAHMSQEQAEGVADALAEAMSGAELATKGDVVTAKAELKADLAETRAELKAEIAAVSAELRADLVEVEHHLDAKIASVKADIARIDERIERRAAETESRLTRWLVCTAVAAIVTIIGTGWTIIRYLPPHP